MSWIQDNKVPAAILGLTGVGVLGLGFVLFNNWSAASTAQEEFDSINLRLDGLKKAALSPTPENLAKKQALVKDYETEVGKLTKVLFTLQPADQPTTADKFQAKLKTKVADIKKEGTNRLPNEFNLGFDQYAKELPKNDQVASELSTYLDAVDLVARLALKSGVANIIALERSPLPAEKSESASSTTSSNSAQSRPAASGTPSITERRQVTLTVRADQAGLQTLLSGFASPTDMPFFTVVRLLRIENEVQQGPLRVPIAGGPDLNKPEPVGEVKPGIQPAPKDSKVVLGTEMLRAYIEIDLVKFLNPQTAAASR